MRKVKVIAAIATAVIALVIWVGCAWIAFSPDEVWTQYRRDCVGFMAVSAFITAMVATFPISGDA